MRLELNGIYCGIRTKQLTPTCVHGVINVAPDDEINKVNVAMNRFNVRLFKINHISYYTRQDIDILDEFRTISDLGILKALPTHTK